MQRIILFYYRNTCKNGISQEKVKKLKMNWTDIKWLLQTDMQNKQRSKSKATRAKNINWLVKQYVLTIACVFLKDKINLELHITISSNQSHAYCKTSYFICHSFKYVTNGKPATYPTLQLASFTFYSHTYLTEFDFLLLQLISLLFQMKRMLIMRLYILFAMASNMLPTLHLLHNLFCGLRLLNFTPYPFQTSRGRGWSSSFCKLRSSSCFGILRGLFSGLTWWSGGKAGETQLLVQNWAQKS